MILASLHIPTQQELKERYNMDEETGEVKTIDYKDLPEENKVDVSTIALEDLVDTQIVVHMYRERPSEFSKSNYVEIDCEVEGDMVTVSTGATSVIKQLEAMAGQMPVRVWVRKKGRRYYFE